MKTVTKKNEKEKKTVLDVQFSTKKTNSQQRKTARYRKTPMKSKIVSFGSYVWLFLLDFPQTEIAC